MQLAEMPTTAIIERLRQMAIERPDFDVAETVTLSGQDVLAIAKRLERTVARF